MKTTTIICDSCGKDLTFTGNCEDYYLTVASASKWKRGNFVTLMAISPPLDREHTFCGLSCLDLWTARRQYITSLRAQWWEQWHVEKGTVNGAFTLYPVPREIEAARDADFEAQANAKFPAFVGSK